LFRRDLWLRSRSHEGLRETRRGRDHDPEVLLRQRNEKSLNRVRRPRRIGDGRRFLFQTVGHRLCGGLKRRQFVNLPQPYRLGFLRPNNFARCPLSRRPIVNAPSLFRQRRERQPLRPAFSHTIV